MANFISIIVAIIVLGVLIFIHELGHFCFARLLGIDVEEFAMGFGPAIFSTVKKNIRYSLRILPLGGYCKFYADDLDDSVPKEKKDPRNFNNHKPWKRFVVIAAGALVNICFAVVIAFFVLLKFGDYSLQIEKVEQNSRASQAGVLPGDILIAIDGKQISLGENPAQIIQKAKNNRVVITLNRENQTKDIVVENIFDQKSQTNKIGIQIQNSQTRRLFTPKQAAQASLRFVSNFVSQMKKVLGGIFTSAQTRSQMMGPVGTIGLIGEAARSGFESILRMMLLLSINIGIFNLLPFPGLDGSRLIFIAIEIIFRKPVSRKAEAVIHFFGMAALFALMIYFTGYDIGRIFAR